MTPADRVGRMAWLSLMFAVGLLGACGAERPAVKAEAPGSGRAAGGGPDARCVAAARQRARVARLLTEGKLDRVVRVIRRADLRCPATAHRTRAELAWALAELGEYGGSRELAAAVVADGEHASSEQRALARRALVLAESHGRRSGVDEPAQSEEMRRVRAAGLSALGEANEPGRRGRLRLARDLCLRAWDLRRPNGRALHCAAQAAKRLGQPAEAQRLFDRAAADLERETGSRVTLSMPYEVSDQPNAVAWSPEGGYALARGAVVSVFDAGEHQERLRLAGHALAVTTLAFSPGGQMLASGSEDRTVRLWDAETGALVRDLAEHRDSVLAVAFSPEGRRLASGSADGTVRVWDVSTGELERQLAGHRGRVTSVAFSPEGRTLASGSDDRTVRLWDVSTGGLGRRLVGHEDRVTSVAFSPEGRRLASGSADGTVRLWDATTGATMGALAGHGSGVTSVTFSPEGRTLASGSDDGTVRLWDGSTRALVRVLAVDSLWVRAVAFSPDGLTLASVAAEGVAASMTGRVVFGAVHFWDTRMGIPVRVLAYQPGRVGSVAFSPDGRVLGSASGGGAVRVWDARTGALVRELDASQGKVERHAFSPDGRSMVTWSADGSVRSWDRATGALLWETAYNAWVPGISPRSDEIVATVDRYVRVGSWVPQLALSPDGRTLTGWSGTETVKSWDARTGELLREHPVHGLAVWSVGFSPDGRTLASGSIDGEVQVWDAWTGAPARELAGHGDRVEAVAVSPDGSTVASGSADRTVRLWDVRTGALRRQLTGHRHEIRSVAFSPDGRTLASGSAREVRLWDVATGVPGREFEGDGRLISSGPFSADGQTLALEGPGLAVRLVRISDGRSLVLHAASGSGPSHVLAEGAETRIELFGDRAAEHLRCRVGPLIFPFELCAERFATSRLASRFLAGDASWAEP